MIRLLLVDDHPVVRAGYQRLLELAGDMGVLLKIERTLARGIAKARSQWEGDMPLFPISKFGLAEEAGEFEHVGPANRQSSEELDFWERAERLVLRALEEYANTARGAGVARRRLFADDAAHGFALADLVSKKFDIVLMNPPFGSGSLKAKSQFEKSYPLTKNDIFAAFVERGIELLHPRSRLGAITSRTGFFLSSFQHWREDVLLGRAPPVILADLGYGVLDDAMVEVAAYCVEAVGAGSHV